MQPILGSAQMQQCDKNTIESHGVPSLVLMERAALAVVENINRIYPDIKSVTVICGPGNNGGDGVAIGRMLHLQGIRTQIVLLGNPEKYSKQLREQIAIAESYQVEITYGLSDSCDADLYVDAMFGIGLTRGLSCEFAQAAELMNESGRPIVAVDIASGYSADNGKLLGEVGIRTALTVTFAYPKKGHVLGQCKQASGELVVADVGIYLDASEQASAGEENCSEEDTKETSQVSRKESAQNDIAYLLDETILAQVPARSVTANKGTCGKVLVIAGSAEIYGACYLSAKAALVAGSGLVRIYTHENNRASIQQALPEAMYTCYQEFEESKLLDALSWADAVILGPGLSTSNVAHQIVRTVLENVSVPLVIDADGVNVVAKHLPLLDEATIRTDIILTPHLKEMERLSGISVPEIDANMEQTAVNFASAHHCTIVLKNHTTVIVGKQICYCTSGNQALATPGSGDVLAGIIGSFLGQGCLPENAATAGAYLHGAAGTKASYTKGMKGVLASDIIAEIVI